MSQIAVIANTIVGTEWAHMLHADGHDAETFTGYGCAAELFAGEPKNILVIDIENPDWPESLLIAQTHSIWPDCKIVAVVSSYAFRTSAVHEMGLWLPHHILMRPMASRLLCATVNFLWAKQRAEEIRRQVAGPSCAIVQPSQAASDPANAADALVDLPRNALARR